MPVPTTPSIGGLSTEGEESTENSSDDYIGEDSDSSIGGLSTEEEETAPKRKTSVGSKRIRKRRKVDTEDESTEDEGTTSSDTEDEGTLLHPSEPGTSPPSSCTV
jgi:hypothetical protein